MTFDLNIWQLVHLDTVQVKFSGQGHGSKFTVTGGEKFTEENIFGYACTLPRNRKTKALSAKNHTRI